MHHFSKALELSSESSLSEWLCSSISIVSRTPCQSRSSNMHQGWAGWVWPPLSCIEFLSAAIHVPCNCQAAVLGPVKEYVGNRSRLACSVDWVLQGFSVEICQIISDYPAAFRASLCVYNWKLVWGSLLWSCKNFNTPWETGQFKMVKLGICSECPQEKITSLRAEGV